MKLKGIGEEYESAHRITIVDASEDGHWTDMTMATRQTLTIKEPLYISIMLALTSLPNVR